VPADLFLILDISGSLILAGRKLGVDCRSPDGSKLRMPQSNRPGVRFPLGFRLASGGAEGRHRLTESHHNGNLRHCGSLIIHKGPSVPLQDSVGCRNFSRPMLIEPRNWNLSSLQADSAGAFAGALGFTHGGIRLPSLT
jgi:hypothetical protein